MIAGEKRTNITIIITGRTKIMRMIERWEGTAIAAGVQVLVVQESDQIRGRRTRMRLRRHPVGAGGTLDVRERAINAGVVEVTPIVQTVKCRPIRSDEVGNPLESVDVVPERGLPGIRMLIRKQKRIRTVGGDQIK